MNENDWMTDLLIEYADDPNFENEGIIFALKERVKLLEKQREGLLVACEDARNTPQRRPNENRFNRI
jgi:hypothetical protein